MGSRGTLPPTGIRGFYENALYKFTFDIDKFDIGHPQFGNDPYIEPRLEETNFTLTHRTPKPRKLPHRTSKNWRRGLPSLLRLWVAQVPSPLWVGIRNSALIPHTKPMLEETSFTLPHRTPKPQKTTTPDPTKFTQGSPQSGKTMGGPDTLPLWVGTRNSAVTPIHSIGLKRQL